MKSFCSRIALYFLTGAVLISCGALPGPDVSIVDRERDTLRALRSDQLCRGYDQAKTRLYIGGDVFIYGEGNPKVDIRAADRQSLIRDELVRRGAVRPNYWKDIDAGIVRVGMTETELFCAVDPWLVDRTAMGRTTSIHRKKAAGEFTTVDGVVTEVAIIIRD